MKKRVLLRVAYDGTNYHGWQVQPGAVTIEQVLNEKLTELLGEPIEVIGASRTDSGVHAMGNRPISCEKLDKNTNYAHNRTIAEIPWRMRL